MFISRHAPQNVENIGFERRNFFGEAGMPLKINIILFPQPLFKVSNALLQGAWLRSNIFLCVRIRSLLIDSKTQKKATELSVAMLRKKWRISDSNR